MKIGDFLEDKFGLILLHLICAALLSAFLFLTGTAAGVIAIILALWFLILLLTQAAAFIKLRARMEELESIMNALPQKYLFAECVKPRGLFYERRLFELMRRCGKSMIEEVAAAQAAQRDYQEYIESWVHEIKAPLTAAELICRKIESENRRKLMQELTAVEAHVERVLYYARAESAEKDFVIRTHSLSEIAAQAIDKHRALLIQSGVRVETENLEQPVYTDDKWAVFILGQLLQNAVRYRSDKPLIRFSAETLGQLTRLVIYDNGIGINEHELPRIFERGFTGTNGRARGGSTGMGLYICRRMAGLLSIGIKFESCSPMQPGLVGCSASCSPMQPGTTVTLTFPAKSNLSKM